LIYFQLGLLVGAKLYFAFHSEAISTDDAFLQQVDLVERELGERGKVKGESRSLSEGVPPSIHPVSTPAPAPVPEPAPSPAPTPASTNGDSFSPSTHVQLSPEPIVEDLSLVQVLLAQQASLIVDQQKLMHEREE
jgi:hypothetical protein